MECKKKIKVKNLSPNSKIVAVKKDLNSPAKFYEVFNPKGYINKCIQDGKIAYYVGVSDENGELELEI